MNSLLKKVMMGLCSMTVLCMSGCGSRNEDTEQVNAANNYGIYEFHGVEGVRYAEKYQRATLSEAGIIYEGNDELLHLITIDEGEDMILCYDPNCTHAPATMANPDPKCMAALYREKTYVGYYEGTIYFFVNDGAFNHKIYKMNTNGAGRECIADELPFRYHINYGLIFREDKMYYSALIPYSDEKTYTVSYMIRLVEFDLLTNTYRFITEESDDTINLMHLAGDYMYMRKADIGATGQVYVSRVNINTLEEEVVIPPDIFRSEYVYVRANDGDSFFYYDRQNSEIGIRSVDGSQKEVILKGADGENFGGWECPSGNYIYYKRTIEFEDEEEGDYLIDLMTGVKYDVTKETKKYGIVAFDAYYDAFITRDADFNWGMQSREKILAEAAD